MWYSVGMNVLVACEMSGVVRDAFRARGHNAYSCDLMPSRRPGPHLLGDVRPHLDLPWDLVIAFPPCTLLCTQGYYWHRRDQCEVMAAVQFVRLLADAASRTCVENPQGVLSRLWRRPDQYVEPWWFGHPWTKRTGLWLSNLAPLAPTYIVEPQASWLGMHSAGYRDRRIRRALTPEGLAQAMAEQWG